MHQEFIVLDYQTSEPISIIDITADVRRQIERSTIYNGLVVVSSRHTTTAISINEYEKRLLDDLRAWLTRLAPPGASYLHNDIHLRDCPPDEPANAHSHLMAMLLGSSETIPLINGELALGQWQSILLFDLDGPRRRTVNVQLWGDQA